MKQYDIYGNEVISEETYKRAIELLKFYADYNNWNHNEIVKTEDIEQFIIKNECDFGADEYLLQDEVGGLLAREFLKEIGEL